uniref:DUF1409 domain-containing protein n=1 Tax=Oryza barthii TaxID=65489 RepID=A0A0D3HTP7_9ORYZ
MSLDAGVPHTGHSTSFPHWQTSSEHAPSHSIRLSIAITPMKAQPQTAAPRILATLPPLDTIRSALLDITNRLNASLDALVENYVPIWGRIEEVQNLLPDEVINDLAPTAYLETYRIKVFRAR